MLLRIFSALGALLFLGAASAELGPEIQEAKNKGLALYQQHKQISAAPYLRVAAEAGDREAQYFLGEALRHAKFFMTRESQKWYEAAAEQGDIHAMLRLASKEDLCNTLNTCDQDSSYWQKRAYEAALARAEQGDAEAMGEMYSVTGELSWLEQAAEAGAAEYQSHLSARYKEGAGWFFLPGARQEAAEKWAKIAAENGFPKAMMKMFEICATRGDFESAREWLKKAVETGIVDAVSTYGANLVHMPDQMGFPLDKVKGYAFLSLVAEIRHEGHDFERDLIKAIEPTMSAEEVMQAKDYAAEWKTTHPPLSYFDPRFGF